MQNLYANYDHWYPNLRSICYQVSNQKNAQKKAACDIHCPVLKERTQRGGGEGR